MLEYVLDWFNSIIHSFCSIITLIIIDLSLCICPARSFF